MKKLLRFLPLLLVIPLLAACAKPDGHPLVHAKGQWPAVVVEDHTTAAFPVNGSFGAWGIQGAIRGNCSAYPSRICYRFVMGSTSTNGAYTSWQYYSAGPNANQKFWCTTTINPGIASASAAARTELVRHEIGHCYGLAHEPQGTGTMEPTVTGRFATPTADERSTLRSLYVGG